MWKAGSLVLTSSFKHLKQPNGAEDLERRTSLRRHLLSSFDYSLLTCRTRKVQVSCCSKEFTMHDLLSVSGNSQIGTQLAVQ